MSLEISNFLISSFNLTISLGMITCLGLKLKKKSLQNFYKSLQNAECKLACAASGLFVATQMGALMAHCTESEQHITHAQSQ